MQIPRVAGVGYTAHAALARARGVARVYAPLSASIYMTAADDIIWLGPANGTPHARAVLCADTPDALGHPSPRAGTAIVLDVSRLTPWRPPRGPGSALEGAAMIAGARHLGAGLHSIGVPAGFAPVCVGAAPVFPLDVGAQRAHALGQALAQACVAANAEACADAAIALLGLGPGLTPSGDDFAGAALFARVLLARAGADHVAAWRAAADRVLAAAPALTHPISVALLGDLLDGAAHGPLHDLAHALATEAPASVVVDAAARLIRIGHTSGWDMLAGFVAGAAGLPT